jgi:small-conductance mechanosensitive channel/CRP-like cAMP-binding protein
MRYHIRKIGLPICIFLVFSVLTALSGRLSSQLGEQEYHGLITIFNYIVQIGMVLSGLFFLNRLMNAFVWDNIVARTLDTVVPRLVKDLFTALICIVGITIIVGVIFDSSVTGIWATSSAMGVVIGFALRSLILDTFTGLAINFENPYKQGDWVHVHSRDRLEYIGCISEISWRTTRIKTTDNNIIVVPNSIIGQSVVTNFSRPETISRFELHFCLDYSVSSERALRVLLAGVKEAIGPDGIEGEPEPTVRINRIVESGVEYRVRYWIYPDRISPPKARHLVIQNILRNLNITGISFAYPKQDVFYARMPSRYLDSDSMDDKIKILSSIELFKNLSMDALYKLAKNLEKVTFNRSETIVRIGDEGNSMYIIIEGFVEAYVYNEEHTAQIKVGHISAGQFFGEMALLTGQPRSASVIAATDVLGYEVTYDNMKELIHSYPEVLETISQVVVHRHMREKRLLETMQHEEELIEATQNLTDEILTSITRFFGLVRQAVTHRRKGL